MNAGSSRRSGEACSSSRLKKENKLMEIKVNDFLEADKVQTFDDLVNKLHIEVKSEDVILHQTSNVTSEKSKV